MRHHICILAFLAFQMLPSTAHALSCAAPVMDEKAIEGAIAIFEGTMVAVQSETPQSDRAPSKMDVSGVYAFKVTKSWKGVEEGATVEIARNIYWGDGFEKGVDYLIVAETAENDTLVAGLCGLSARVEHADKSLKYLKKHYSESSK